MMGEDNAATDAPADRADPETAPTHRVVVNHEEQYALWPADKAIPEGWSQVFEGGREACLEHVERVWTDMRPLSVRGSGA
jgi:MbtH protein